MEIMLDKYEFNITILWGETHGTNTCLESLQHYISLWHPSWQKHSLCIQSPFPHLITGCQKHVMCSKCWIKIMSGKDIKLCHSFQTVPELVRNINLTHASSDCLVRFWPFFARKQHCCNKLKLLFLPSIKLMYFERMVHGCCFLTVLSFCQNSLQQPSLLRIAHINLRG